MDTSIVVALISSVTSLVVAICGAIWTARQNMKANEKLELFRHGLQLSMKNEDRMSEELVRFGMYREPLLAAANELGNRLDSIQNDSFLIYLNAPDHRSRTALLSTLYRFANFFGQHEMIRSNFRSIRFKDNEAPAAVVDLLNNVGRTFASGKLDQDASTGRPRFMFWREEQRAIGELMLEKLADGSEECIGYAAFTGAYDERFERWFAAFAEDLCSAGAAESSKRLERIRSLLANLVIKLDEDKVYALPATDGSPGWRGWVGRVAHGDLSNPAKSRRR